MISMLPSKSELLLAFVLMLIAGLSACMSRPANSSLTIPLSTPTLRLSPLPTSTNQPLTLTPTPTTFVPLVPDDKRIAASIDVGNAPWTMAVENGLLWVIAGDSIMLIDPQTDRVVGKPIPVTVPENAGLEAIVVGQDALWVSIVGRGNIAA